MQHLAVVHAQVKKQYFLYFSLNRRAYRIGDKPNRPVFLYRLSQLVHAGPLYANSDSAFFFITDK